MNLVPFNASDWYWYVGDDRTKAWSSATSSWVTQVPEDHYTVTDDLDAVLRRLGLKTSTISQEEVILERNRRMALGFDYDFKDSRGVHHIGTTEQDMLGWQEVTTLANVYISLGKATQIINIVTNTAPVQVTAAEWMMILLGAAAYRQPLWAKSFILQNMSPIPSNYTDDSYWS